MKKMLFVLLLLNLPYVMASSYGVYSPDDYSDNFSSQNGERLLFILDYSNSMNEILDSDTKYNVMLYTMSQILPKISNAAWIGLRIYGHKMGFTPLEACRASALLTPISQKNIKNIETSMQKRKPRGMTPITYSLKQAIKYDFMGFPGKKHIILMTDGGENCDESPCEFVMNLIKIRRDIQIDVIALNVKDINDLEQLKCTALVTSGKFYNANTSAQLFDGFNKSLESSMHVEAKILLPGIK